jgi:hypothetical protein
VLTQGLTLGQEFLLLFIPIILQTRFLLRWPNNTITTHQEHTAKPHTKLYETNHLDTKPEAKAVHRIAAKAATLPIHT